MKNLTEAQKQILDFFKKLKRFNLEGNREYYSTLIYSNGEYSIIYGETFGDGEPTIQYITEHKALMTIKEHFRDKWDIKDEVELLELWKEIADI